MGCGKPREANKETGMTKIYIGFQDWNNGGLLGEYTAVEVKELTKETVRDAAQHLVDRGYGYWRDIDMMPGHGEDRMTEEEYANNPAVDRYWVHAATCPEGAEMYNSMRSECVCDLNEKLGGEIEAPYDAEPTVFQPV